MATPEQLPSAPTDDQSGSATPPVCGEDQEPKVPQVPAVSEPGCEPHSPAAPPVRTEDREETVTQDQSPSIPSDNEDGLASSPCPSEDQKVADGSKQPPPDLPDDDDEEDDDYLEGSYDFPTELRLWRQLDARTKVPRERLLKTKTAAEIRTFWEKISHPRFSRETRAKAVEYIAISQKDAGYFRKD